MKYFRWSQFGGADESTPKSVWYLSLHLEKMSEWDLMAGKNIENWDTNTTAIYDEELEFTDYPFTSGSLPVYSSRLKSLMERLGIEGIQYLPLRIRRRDEAKVVDGYHVANYLRVIDCLNRKRSIYQEWTKENLLFWEKRPYMLGTYRDVTKTVVDLEKIANVPIFRLWGWEVMVVVREDVKRAVEEARITGCVFYEIEAI